MSGAAMKLVRFVCTADAHASGRSDVALTIHEGAWAFCAAGADAAGHRWAPSDGLPIVDAMRFTPRQHAPPTAPEAVAHRPAVRAAPALSAKGRARSR